MSVSDLEAVALAVLPDLPAHGQIRRLALSGTAGTVGRARDHTRRALHDWGWLPTQDPDQRARADDVLLLVSELVTNACRHTDGPEHLTLRATPTRLRIEVTDTDPTHPAPRRPHLATSLGGHGLHTVALLASRWGSAPHPDRPGKTVWAEIDLPTP
ncbi:ATP-binding protein [Kitasatospora sp. NBC_01287]|uniref:ATP-binding protein n=1 Tax=Kitasatospora sp. NBC_01287 TaxID=2903573 RepID=UPI002253C666|nr:ATP-binding protein [Kitasatospora sp. NBC_01287]MCX4751659.1 ATP-binding protein [Kitasatospora sp. NBC_01287]